MVGAAQQQVCLYRDLTRRGERDGEEPQERGEGGEEGDHQGGDAPDTKGAAAARGGAAG